MQEGRGPESGVNLCFQGFYWNRKWDFCDCFVNAWALRCFLSGTCRHLTRLIPSNVFPAVMKQLGIIACYPITAQFVSCQVWTTSGSGSHSYLCADTPWHAFTPVHSSSWISPWELGKHPTSTQEGHSHSGALGPIEELYISAKNLGKKQENLWVWKFARKKSEDFEINL